MMWDPFRPHWSDAPLAVSVVCSAVIGFCYVVAALIRAAAWFITHLAHA